MWLLIGVNRRTREREQNEFVSQEDLYECLNSKFTKCVRVDNRNEPQPELLDRLMDACRQNSIPAYPSIPVVYEPHKDGTHVITYSSKRGGLQTFNIFFVCEAEQK